MEEEDFELAEADNVRATKYALVDEDGAAKPCCSLECLKHVVFGLSNTQRQVCLGAGKTWKMRQQTITDELLLRREHGIYHVAGFVLCRKAYCLVRGISERTLVRYKALMNQQLAIAFQPGHLFNTRVAEHGRTGAVIMTEKMANTLRWLRQTLSLYGEHSPEDGRIHVLMFLNPTWLHMQLTEWASLNDVRVLKLRRFLDLFNGESPCSKFVNDIVWKRDVKAKRCGVCMASLLRRLKLVRAGKTRASQEWLECNGCHKAHLGLVGVERVLYMQICKNAPTWLNHHVLIIDAGHPLRTVRKITDTEAGRSLLQLVHPLIGIIDHTLERKLVFTSPANGIPRYNTKGELTGTTWDAADVEVSLLLQYLDDLHQKRALRPHLHVQVDGGSTARSFALFVTLSLIMLLGWVKRVTIASLIPGLVCIFLC